MRIFTKRLIALLVFISVFSVYAQSEELENPNPEASTGSSDSTTTNPAAKPDVNAEVPAAKTEAAADEDLTSAKGEIFVNSKTAFELHATDDDSSVDFIEYKVNNGEFTKYSSPISLSEEGSNKITYRSIDKAENKEASKVLVITVDNTAPKVDVVSSAPIYEASNGARFAPKGIAIELKATDNISGVSKLEYSLNGSEMQAYSAPVSVPNPGSNILKYKAVDNAQNTTGDTTYILSVDENKPRVDIKSSLPSVTIGEKVYSRKGSLYTVVAVDEESGIKSVLVKVDNAADYMPYVEPITFATAGEHVVEAKAVDNVGNESDLKKVTFMVDVNPPKTVIKKVSNN